MFNVKTFNYYIDKVVDYIKDNPPTCNDEFKLYTKIFYGVELGCSWESYLGKQSCCGNYKVLGKEDDYSKVALYRCWERKFGQYDGLKVLLDSTFGKLCCGGVANQHYGQVEISREKSRSLLDWDISLDDVHKYIKEIELLKLIDGLPEVK